MEILTNVLRVFVKKFKEKNLFWKLCIQYIKTLNKQFFHRTCQLYFFLNL